MYAIRSYYENRIAYELWANQNGVALADDASLLEGEGNLSLINKVKQNRGIQAAHQIDEKIATVQSQKGSKPLDFIEDMVPDNVFKALSDNGSMLKVIFFALFFGIALLAISKEKAQPVVNVIDGFRITSYNVCYTKLLRSNSKSSLNNPK